MSEGERLYGITERIIGAAIEVHRALGPGLLEVVDDFPDSASSAHSAVGEHVGG